jgi:hypothetical protein
LVVNDVLPAANISSGVWLWIIAQISGNLRQHVVEPVVAASPVVVAEPSIEPSSNHVAALVTSTSVQNLYGGLDRDALAQVD